MLRAAWRALSAIAAPTAAQVPVCVRPGARSARLPLAACGLQPPSLLRAARGYAVQKPVQPMQDDELPPSTLIRDYQNIPAMEKVDDVVKRILSVEMASRREKLNVKKEQLMSKIVANPEDTRSLEAKIVALTVRIRNYEEHMQKHRKDKAHKRYLQMSIDKRNKALKNLRMTNYDVFEKTCRELGIEYTIPPLYPQKTHRRYLVKKALCIQVFQEVQKLKKQRRALKAAAAAARKQDKQGDPEILAKAQPEASKENQ